MLKPLFWLFLTLVLMACSNQERIRAEEAAKKKGKKVAQELAQPKEVSQEEPNPTIGEVSEPSNSPPQEELPLIIDSKPGGKPSDGNNNQKQRRNQFIKSVTAKIEMMGGYTIYSKHIPEAAYLQTFFDDIKNQVLLKKYKKGLPFALTQPSGEVLNHKVQVGVVLPAFYQYESNNDRVHLGFPKTPVKTVILGELNLKPDFTEQDYVQACKACYSVWSQNQKKLQTEH